MSQIVSIAVGGAFGALARYWISVYITLKLGHGFPYGTLTVNVVGCLLMGFLTIILLERAVNSEVARAALLIGFLGSFTTFSTFSMETLKHFQQGDWMIALGNIVLSVVCCLIATLLGVFMARQLV